MILALAGLALGAALGAVRARARGGNAADIVQYAVVHGLLLAVIGLFVAIALVRTGI